MSVVSGVVGALTGADASRSAANTQADAAREAARMQMEMFEKSREDYAPWRKAGSDALNVLSGKIAAGPGNYRQSPGYEYRLKEGLDAVEASAAARGRGLSGATMRGLNRYAQDYATNDYDNFLTRYYQSLTPHQSMAGVGMTALQTTSNLGANAANQAGMYNTMAGNALAGGYINQANAITGAIGSAGNNAIAGYNAWRNSQYSGGSGGYTPSYYGGNFGGGSGGFGSTGSGVH